MGQRTEHELCLANRDVVGRDKRHVSPGDARGRSPLLVRRREGEREHRMAQDQRRKLAASVSAGTEHAHWYLIHKECIIMQSLDVNALELIARLGERFVDTSVEDRCEPKK